jgi:hypothetical protein
MQLLKGREMHVAMYVNLCARAADFEQEVCLLLAMLQSGKVVTSVASCETLHDESVVAYLHEHIKSFSSANMGSAVKQLTTHTINTGPEHTVSQEAPGFLISCLF